jgi:hypothetical protein
MGAKSEMSALLPDTVQVIADSPFDMAEYSTGFDNSMAQKFTVVSNKISVVSAAKGLKVTIDPSALEKEDGASVNGKIEVNIIELTSGNDMFKSNAATVCDGRLLASGGSYFVGMESDGKKLRIKKGKALLVDFPVHTNSEMELFYGERNDENNMNWKRAGLNLQAKKDDDLFIFNDNNFADYYPAETYLAKNKLNLFKSLNEKVYYYNKKMTLGEIVDTINRYSKKVFLETVYTWPKELEKLPAGTWVDTSYLLRIYGPPKQYYLKTYKSLQDEKERITKQKALRDSMFLNWQSQSLSGQIQKYYQPAAISTLGWINCDRFYQYREQTQVELELPVTFISNKVQFFIIFKSFNGLLNYRIDSAGPDNNMIYNLPVGEQVTLLGFSKINGNILHCREEFVISKNKPVRLNFKHILPEEMKKMFGKNLRI